MENKPVGSVDVNELSTGEIQRIINNLLSKIGSLELEKVNVLSQVNTCINILNKKMNQEQENKTPEVKPTEKV